MRKRWQWLQKNMWVCLWEIDKLVYENIYAINSVQMISPFADTPNGQMPAVNDNFAQIICLVRGTCTWGTILHVSNHGKPHNCCRDGHFSLRISFKRSVCNCVREFVASIGYYTCTGKSYFLFIGGAFSQRWQLYSLLFRFLPLQHQPFCVRTGLRAYTDVDMCRYKALPLKFIEARESKKLGSLCFTGLMVSQ